MSSIKDVLVHLKNKLSNIYDEREANAMSYLLLEHLTQWSRTKIQLNQDEKIEQEQIDLLEKYLSDLLKKKPLQYVVGETEFYELSFKVNENTLIPRPETEELVHAIITENKQQNVSILDIGTGSGCIPISLAKNIPDAKVASTDLSEEASKMAQQNAKLNQVEVLFLNQDILKWKEFDWEQYDIIVSNPPYVMEKEKELMDENVLNFEPHLALFVSNNDPLIFYRTIAEFAQKHLKKGGLLYFEINENLGQEMIHLLQEKGFSEIELRKDINGKDRMTKAVKKR
jgi:release factor glutamine methyltransferase